MCFYLLQFSSIYQIKGVQSQIKNIEQIFSNPQQQIEFLKEIKEQIPCEYKYLTTAISNSRVNIISEHTDYHLYPVNPIALEKYFTFSISYKEGSQNIFVKHFESQFEDDQWNSQEQPENISKYNGKWSMYVRAGFLAACMTDKELQKSMQGKDILLVGRGNIPQASGLSSSSALTCCSALSFLAFSQKSIDKIQLAANCAKAEATVAIEGGGMDQAISLNGKKGQVCIVNFQPLQFDYCDMPQNIKIGVFSSLKDSKKATEGFNFYNTRVAEGRVGNAILVQKYFQRENKDFKFAQQDKIYVGRDVQQLYQFQSPSKMLKFVEELPEEISLQDASQLLGYKSIDELKQKLLLSKRQLCLLKDFQQTLVIKRRLQHVYSEAFRSCAFGTILKDDEMDKEMQLQLIGELINDSHTSCKNDYECSCNELDNVVQLAKNCGAFCARMTGAGMGGYAVALIQNEFADEWLNQMKTWYSKQGIQKQQLDDVVFLTEPCEGGCFVNIE